MQLNVLKFRGNLRMKFILFLQIYFLLQVFARSYFFEAFRGDEGEQIIFSREWRITYHAHVPLYHWLQKIVFTIFEVNIFSLALLKNALLFLTYYFVYKTADLIFKNGQLVFLSTISLFLLPRFHWETHAYLTHTVLCVAICSISMYLIVKILISQEWKYFLFLGIAIGVGLLSKYNYIIFIMGVLLSIASIHSYRKSVFLQKKLILILIPAILISFFPYYIMLSDPVGVVKEFLYSNRELNILEKLKVLRIYFTSVLECVALVGISYLVLFPKGFVRKYKNDNFTNEMMSFFKRSILSMLLIFAFTLVYFGIDIAPARWFHPFFLFLPLCFFMNIDVNNVQKWKILVIIILVALSMIAVSHQRYVRVWYGKDSASYKELAKTIKSTIFSKGILIAPEEGRMAGNLQYYFRDSFILSGDRLTPQLNKELAKSPYKDVLVVWGEEHEREVPEDMIAILMKMGFQLNDIMSQERIILFRKPKEKKMKVYIILLEKD